MIHCDTGQDRDDHVTYVHHPYDEQDARQFVVQSFDRLSRSWIGAPVQRYGQDVCRESDPVRCSDLQFLDHYLSLIPDSGVSSLSMTEASFFTTEEYLH